MSCTCVAQQILCDSEDPDIQTWAMLMNMHIADNPQRGVTDLLSRAEGALDTKYKPAEATAARQPHANASINDTTNASEKTTPESMEVVANEHETKSESMEQEEKKSGGAEETKTEFVKWKKENTAVDVNLLAVHEDRLQAEATIGPDYLPFQVLFNDCWKPMVLMKAVCVFKGVSMTKLVSHSFSYRMHQNYRNTSTQ